MKRLILISSIITLFFQEEKKVYICKKDNASFIQYDRQQKEVNLYIESELIKDKKLQRGIKLYIASFFVKDKDLLVRDFTTLYKQSPAAFALHHKKEISNVIYYLEHVDHGNLPLIYGRDAYILLELKELQPFISSFKKKLLNGNMLLIDMDVYDKTTPKDIDNPVQKNK